MKDILKKNLVSIICGVIALVAVGALFWPVSGYYAELQEQADQRLKEYNDLNTLNNKDRKLPVTDFKASPDSVKSLQQYPTNAVVAAWNQVTERIKADSDKIFGTALEMNAAGHLPIAPPTVLPAGSQGQLIDFRRNYAALFDFSTPESRENSIVGLLKVRAGSAPTARDIDAAKLRIDKEKEPQKATLPPEMFKNMVDSAKDEVQDSLRREAAEKCTMYMQFEPPSISLQSDDKIKIAPGTTALDHASVFLAQMKLWVQEDVLRALGSANKDAKNVYDAPVKHLLTLRIKDDSLAHFTAAAKPDAPLPAPTTAPSQTLDKKPVSLTQRTSNGLYDVIKFNLRIIVDAEKVPFVMQELCKNQFINVNNMNMQAVDAAQMQGKGYFYGDRPVVYLELACEELMFRENTTRYMPRSVKDSLGFPPDAQAAAPAAAH